MFKEIKFTNFDWLRFFKSFSFKVPEFSVSKSIVDSCMIGNVDFDDNGPQEEFNFDDSCFR